MASLIQCNGVYYITDRLSGKIVERGLRSDNYQFTPENVSYSPKPDDRSFVDSAQRAERVGFAVSSAALENAAARRRGSSTRRCRSAPMRKAICFRSILAVLSVLMLLSGAVGCTATQSRQATEKDAPIRQEDVKVTAEQLRLRMRSLVGPMCGQIEQSADAIITGTPDLNIKLAALNWKMDAVPAMREALFRPDPYSAAFDTAALCMQMIEYFEHGPGKEALGPAASAQAAADCRGMLDEYLKVVASATSSGDVSKARDFVQSWASDHPIRHSISGRESAMSRVYDQEFIVSRSTIEYVADAAATADDLTRKMDVYSDQLVRQVRWEVERLQLELVRDYRIDQAMPLAERAVKSAEQAVTTVDHLAPALERSLAVAEDVPKLAATERETVIKAVHDEMTRVLQTVHDERITAFEQVSKERSTASKELKDALAAQASQLAVDGERISKLEIDYVMERVTRLLVIAAAVAVVVILLGLLIWRSRHSANGNAGSSLREPPVS